MGSRDARDPPRIEGLISIKVDNIPNRFGPIDLREMFGRYGDIGDVHIPKDKWTGENRGFGFVRFYSNRDAEEALDRMDGRTVQGRELRVTMARYGRPCDERNKGRGGGGSRDERRRRSRSRSRRRSPSYDRRRRRSRSRSPPPVRRHVSRSRSRSVTPKNSAKVSVVQKNGGASISRSRSKSRSRSRGSSH